MANSYLYGCTDHRLLINLLIAFNKIQINRDDSWLWYCCVLAFEFSVGKGVLIDDNVVGFEFEYHEGRDYIDFEGTVCSSNGARVEEGGSVVLGGLEVMRVPTDQ
jgi:hypothetical protein